MLNVLCWLMTTREQISLIPNVYQYLMSLSDSSLKGQIGQRENVQWWQYPLLLNIYQCPVSAGS